MRWYPSLALVTACAVDEMHTDSAVSSDMADTAAAAWTEQEAPTPPMLQAAADREARLAWGFDRAVGNLSVPDGYTMQLYGAREAVAHYLEGWPVEEAPAGVLVDDESGLCVGRIPLLPDGLAASRDDILVSIDSMTLEGAGPAVAMEHCTAPTLTLAALAEASGRLRVEADALDWEGRFLDAADEPPPPPATCSSTCGSTQGHSYAGQTAYSNGSYTGSGSSCGGTGTYGYHYQCVEYTERVAGRSDWAGNAYTGYWTNTGLSSSSSSQGPYYKGLLPLGSGTGYLAPQAGDVVVWSGGTYGHVGVLSAVYTSTVRVIDQNRSCGDQSCDLTYGSSYTLGNGSGSGMCGSEGLSSYTPRGYLHRGWDFGGSYQVASSATTGTSQHNWWLNDASYHSGTTSGSVTDITDYITINPGATDPYMTSPPSLKIPAYSTSAPHGYRYVSFYIKSNCANKSARLYWKRTTDSSFSESRAVSTTISGSSWQTLTFNVSSNSSWSGTIDQIRLDPASSCSTSSSDTISLQSAWFWR